MTVREIGAGASNLTASSFVIKPPRSPSTPTGGCRANGIVGMVQAHWRSLTALVVVPLWAWRSLYWLVILPALLVLWVRLGVKENPRFERVTMAMLTEELKKHLNIWSPIREYPREMLTATFLYFLLSFHVDWLVRSGMEGRMRASHPGKPIASFG
jgi:hypothetical protein